MPCSTTYMSQRAANSTSQWPAVSSGRRCKHLAIALLLLHLPRPAATLAGDLQDLLGTLYGGDGITLQRNTVAPQFSHHAHFTTDSLTELQDVARSISDLSRPSVAASSGLRFDYDPVVGGFFRARSALGSLFLERPETLPEGYWAFGLSYGCTRYTTLEGRSLSNYELILNHVGTGHSGIEPCLGGDPPFCYAFEKDVVALKLNLDISADYLLMTAHHGLTDRWEISAQLPVQRIAMRITSVASIRNDPSKQYFDRTLHAFDPDNEDSPYDHVRGSHVGIGDMRLTSKYQLFEHENGYSGISLGIRLPTGDLRNLQGVPGVGSQVSWHTSRQFMQRHNLWVLRFLGGVDFNSGVVSATVLRHAYGVELNRKIGSIDAAIALDFLNKRNLSVRDGPGARQSDLGLSLKLAYKKDRLLHFGVSVPQDQNGLRADRTIVLGLEWLL